MGRAFDAGGLHVAGDVGFEGADFKVGEDSDCVMMARDIEELRAKMSPESLARVDARVSRSLELMALHANRRLARENSQILRRAQDSEAPDATCP